jgi:glycine cleavage system H protein
MEAAGNRLQGKERAMSNIPDDVRYTETHEWVRRDGDRFTIGLTDHAQSEMGEIVMVELPEIDSPAARGEALGALEAVKTAEDFYSALDGTVAEVNPELEASPDLINEDPYGKGWLVVVRGSDPSHFDSLMTAEQYASFIGV